ncbi:hypothetical protein L211DRAFT_145809 [Terfezia boudieri ATCC MYA-4762]|uniref:Uncharacterized protein n=1 Tax=Terfezia boudieri ATCC MYA-4762 TaxID=1051890 RepID=A0A3N4LU63_9PEZI|nr:hypothetical protein L211DRAFT_145809 [Terfezia boudieri ATCC MYA-4762]
MMLRSTSQKYHQYKPGGTNLPRPSATMSPYPFPFTICTLPPTFERAPLYVPRKLSLRPNGAHTKTTVRHQKPPTYLVLNETYKYIPVPAWQEPGQYPGEYSQSSAVRPPHTHRHITFARLHIRKSATIVL